ncbi:MAG: matrixin family metalloprotease [Acidobacteriaceae bacterium]
MKKTLTVAGLSAVILLLAVFLTVRFSAQGGAENFFNLKFRPQLSRHPLARQIFGLHFDSDAKADYLAKKPGNIIVEVDSMEGTSLDYPLVQRLADRLAQVTGKQVSILISDDGIPFAKTTDEGQAENLKKQYQDNRINRDNAVLYLLTVNQNQAHPTWVGATLQEDGIMIFSQAVKDLTQDRRERTEDYLYSTLLHEIGHQLGLGHNDGEDCLMNETVEEDSSRAWKDVVVDFCQEEKDQIEAAKRSY